MKARLHPHWVGGEVGYVYRKKQSCTKPATQRCKDATVQKASAAPQALNVGLKVDAQVLVVGYCIQGLQPRHNS